MNFKLKTLVAAVVLSASATSANAAIQVGSNSELVFSAWDTVAGVGYTYDLNWGRFLNDFVGTDLTVANNATLLANAKVGAAMIGVGGVIYDDVLTGLPFSGDVANVQWNLGAADTLSRTRLLTTKDSFDATPFSSTSDATKAAVTAFNTYAPANDGFIAPANALLDDTYAITSDANGAAYPGNGGAGYYNFLADTTNALGGQSFLYLLAQTTLSTSSVAGLQTQVFGFDGSQIVASTYLQAGQWRLNISAVPTAPIPEPETYAMLLAGLGLMGAVARRRSNKSA